MRKLINTFIGIVSIWLSLFSLAHAAITIDTTSTVKNFFGTADVTSTITVGGGSNQLLVVTVCQNNITAPSAILVDTTAPTFVASSNVAQTVAGEYMYYITGLSAGVHNASVTWGANRSGNFELSSYFGALQSGTLETTSTHVSVNVAQASSTITTAVANDLIVDATCRGKSDAITSLVNGSQIPIIKNQGSNGQFGDSSYLITTSTGSYFTGYNLTSVATTTMLQGAFKPVGGVVVNATNAISVTSSALGIGILNVDPSQGGGSQHSVSSTALGAGLLNVSNSTLYVF